MRSFEVIQTEDGFGLHPVEPSRLTPGTTCTNPEAATTVPDEGVWDLVEQLLEGLAQEHDPLAPELLREIRNWS